MRLFYRKGPVLHDLQGNAIANSISPVHSAPASALEVEAAIVERFRDPSVMHQLQFWTTDQCLVAPASLKRQARYDDACAELQASGWPVLIRKTGGGITPQGPGILNVALAYALDPAENPTIHGVYEMFCAPLLRLLEMVGCHANTAFVPGCFCDGEYNVVVGKQKVVGTAQRWTRVRAVESRRVVFAHALILINADLDASIQAVNHLHRACHIKQIITVNSHANLTQLATSREKAIDQQQVVSFLSELYRSELIALTG